MSQFIKDHLELHFIVLLWGFTAVLGLLIQIPPVEVVLFRTLLSSLVLGMVVLALKENFKVKKSTFAIMMGVGVMFSAHWILFFLSARLSNVSVCLAGLATAALWTSIMEPIMRGGKPRLIEIVLSLVAIAGIVIIFSVEVDHFWGLFLAILSAFLYAVFMVINKTLVIENSPFTIMFYEMFGAFLATCAFLPLYGNYFTEGIAFFPSLNDWILLSVMAVFCTVYSFSASVKLMRRLSAFTINLTINLEPVYGILLALIIFGQSEHMQSGFYLGAGLIMLSVAIYPLWLKWTRN